MKRKTLHLGREKTIVTEEEAKKIIRGKNFLLILANASELGFSIALPIGGGVIIGHFLDGKFGMQPAFTLIFLITGIFLGLYNLYRLVQNSTKE